MPLQCAFRTNEEVTQRAAEERRVSVSTETQTLIVIAAVIQVCTILQVFRHFDLSWSCCLASHCYPLP